MQPIKNLADSRERDAGSIVGAAQQHLLEQEQQLEQLRRYRDDHRLKEFGAGDDAIAGAPAGALDALRLQNYQAFLQRLNDAIRAQERAVQVAREDYEHKRDAWRERNAEAKSLGRAIEKIRSEERQVAAHREQRGQDEQAAAQQPNRELANDSGSWKIEGRWKVDK
jgi:flagellar FliJ protein